VADLQRATPNSNGSWTSAAPNWLRATANMASGFEQQSATIDVLNVMSASPGDPQPVFDMIVRPRAGTVQWLGYDVVPVRRRLSSPERAVRQVGAVRGRGVSGAASPGADACVDLPAGRYWIGSSSTIRDIDAEPELLQVMAKHWLEVEPGAAVLRDGGADRVRSRGLRNYQRLLGSQSRIAANLCRAGGDRHQQREDLSDCRHAPAISRESLEYQYRNQRRAQSSAGPLRYPTGVRDYRGDRRKDCAMRISRTFPTARARLIGGARFSDSPDTTRFDAVMQGRLVPADRGSVTGRPRSRADHPHPRRGFRPGIHSDRVHDARKTRTGLGVPLLVRGRGRCDCSGGGRVQPFSAGRSNWSAPSLDQAVIALENARLISETREARSSRPPPLRYCRSSTVRPATWRPCSTRCSTRRCGCARRHSGSVHLMNGEHLRAVAGSGLPPDTRMSYASPCFRPRVALRCGWYAAKAFVQIADLIEDEGSPQGSATRRALVAGPTASSRACWSIARRTGERREVDLNGLVERH